MPPCGVVHQGTDEMTSYVAAGAESAESMKRRWDDVSGPASGCAVTAENSMSGPEPGSTRAGSGCAGTARPITSIAPPRRLALAKAELRSAAAVPVRRSRYGLSATATGAHSGASIDHKRGLAIPAAITFASSSHG